MKVSEIKELLRLKGWSATDLASHLDLTLHAVNYWLKRGGNPSGPAAILMRAWLKEAREAKGQAVAS